MGFLISVIISTYLLIIIYEYFYYKGDGFLKIKKSINKNAKKCNELNKHIEELKQAYTGVKSIDYGDADILDKSNFNYKRPELKNFTSSNNIYNCSLSVCRNAQRQPFKYICKYFNIKSGEETLENFEKVLNDFSAAEQGKVLLDKERSSILDSISNKIPFFLIKVRKTKLMYKLGFETIDFSLLYFPTYSFHYISSGGNSSMKCDVTFNIENLDKFIIYLSEIIKFRKSVAGQRALMTSKLREKIKERDDYTCQNCNLSTKKEQNLLLEIDHIIPLSKHGLTTEENLQVLCWRCNRSKSNKLVEDT